MQHNQEASMKIWKAAQFLTFCLWCFAFLVFKTQRKPFSLTVPKQHMRTVILNQKTQQPVSVFCQANLLTVLDWPSPSPDLNPTEHVFPRLKTKVQNEREVKTAISLGKIHSICWCLWLITPIDRLQKVWHSICNTALFEIVSSKSVSWGLCV